MSDDLRKTYDLGSTAGKITDLSDTAKQQYTGAAPGPATQPVLPPIINPAQPGETTGGASGQPVAAHPAGGEGKPQA